MTACRSERRRRSLTITIRADTIEFLEITVTPHGRNTTPRLYELFAEDGQWQLQDHTAHTSRHIAAARTALPEVLKRALTFLLNEQDAAAAND